MVHENECNVNMSKIRNNIVNLTEFAKILV